MNRTKGFVNLNKFKFGRAIKRLSKNSRDKPEKLRKGMRQGRGKLSLK